MKIAGARLTSTLAVDPPILNRMRKIRACLRKLSLNAAKNCVQKSGAKRRVVSKDVDIRLYSPLGSPSYRYGQPAPFLNFACGRVIPNGSRRGSRLKCDVSVLAPLDFHEQALGLGILDAVHESGALVGIAQSLGQRDTGLDQQDRAHGEIGFDPYIDWREKYSCANHRGGTEERRIGKSDPGTGIMGGVLILHCHCHYSVMFVIVWIL